MTFDEIKKSLANKPTSLTFRYQLGDPRLSTTITNATSNFWTAFIKSRRANQISSKANRFAKSSLKFKWMLLPAWW